MNDIHVDAPILSDHAIVSFKCPVIKPQSSKVTITTRKIKNIDIASFSEDIKRSELCLNPAGDIDSLVIQYDKVLSSIFEKHAPKIEKAQTVRCFSPWFNDDVKKSKTSRRKAERRWRKHKNTIHEELYRAAHKEYVSICEQAKKGFYQSKIDESKGDPKTVYRIADKLMSKNDSLILPSHTDTQELAESFSEYFDDKIAKIRTILEGNRTSQATDEYTAGTVPKMSNFKPVSEDELRKLIMSSNSKSCNLDPIPTQLLKACIDALLPTISDIVNKSIASAIVPNQFKVATVTPLLKKKSLDPENHKNYRPVSNLPYMSKILEKVVMSRLDEHLDSHDLRESLQSAYRSCHSVETALVKVFNDCLLSIDKKQILLLILLDLSAAFDTIDHCVIMQRLEKLFGITGSALDWLRSYFKERFQTVVIKNMSSQPKELSTGVPQGSVVGPSVFSAYTQPLGTIVRMNGVSLHLYADDTQLYTACKVDEAHLSKEKLEECIKDVRNWMADNLLKLNDEKTEYLILGSHHMLKKVPDDLKSVTIGSQTITATDSARNIGVIMDPALTMEKLVATVSRSCYIGMRRISRIRRYISEDTAKNWYKHL